MITAVDTSVLLDVFTADPAFGAVSSRALQSCIDTGALVACDVVWAELAATFPAEREAAAALDRLGVRFVPLQLEATLSAGATWREYRQRGGSRARMIPDFLIGAHARAQADRLLTRDRGFYTPYFDDLDVIDPTA